MSRSTFAPFPTFLLAATVALGLPASVRAATAPPPVDYARQIQPILAENCFHCHGPDAKDRKAGLRLDTREGALKGGRSEVPSLIPGKPADSELLARLHATDPEEVMPPPKENKTLSAAQKDLLRRWIAEGAPYAPHWAFTPPVQLPVPQLSAPAPAAGRSPIDAFVAAKLPAAGLAPAAPADAATLARRLHLDLIGLPPAPADVDAFVADHRRDPVAAVAALTDRLLADERYGERWARVWLDAARYSDSNGYEKDLPREQWAWRDWVIRAFNRDLPYDQFLVEQIAGDLLPSRTQDQLVATGFLRNGMVNEEGAIIPEQFRIEGVFDRLDCLGKATLGLTLSCAQCHTHKFDPVSHDEYFGLYAYLNNTYEAQSWVYTSEQQEQIAKLVKDLAAVDARTKKAEPKWKEHLAAWETALAASRQPWTPLVATELGSVSGLNHPVQLPDRSILTEGHPSTKGDIYVIAAPALAGATGLRVEALCHDDLPFGGPGRSKFGTWAISELELSTQAPGSDKWEKLALTGATVTADFAEPTRGLERDWEAAFDKEHRRIVGPAALMIDGSNDTAWRADRGPGRRNTESVAVIRFSAPLDFPAGTKLKLNLRYHHGGDDNGRHNTMLGRARFALTTVPEPAAAPVDYAALLALDTPAAARTARQQAALFAAWRATVPALKKFHTEAETLWKKYPGALTSVLHLAERSPVDTRATHLLDRGAWDKPTHAVLPHVPAALHPLPADAPANRLTLARWIADPRSPLTARVAVNRVWQALFGTGLVETPEDFGTRTPVPLHLDVLDWLAVDFMQHGWSHKHLLRRVVAAGVYQQSGRATAAALERDPSNRYLARGPRFRVEAEVVRDVALSVAGLLHHKIGGPSLFPPVPENVLSYNYSKVTYWDVPVGPERYRRSLYLFRKRSMPDPMLSAFDAPNGDFACVRRVRSNTPLAALTGLNEPIFVEAAQAFARRIWREGGANDAERIAHAYRLCVARSPRAEETAGVQQLLADTRARLRRGELTAADIAFTAHTVAADLPSDATPADLAAWTVAARVLLNLDETLTKN